MVHLGKKSHHLWYAFFLYIEEDAPAHFPLSLSLAGVANLSLGVWQSVESSN